MLRMKGRHGMTLIELMVVIAIITGLIGLLLPAVQQAREAARRCQCRNNLRQCALALHSYHDLHRSFPPGTMYAHPSGLPDRLRRRGPGWGWSSMILPFLENANLYDRIDWNLPPFDPTNASQAQLANQEIIHHSPPYALCPSDTAPQFFPTAAGNRAVDWATASYAGNGGAFSGSEDGDHAVRSNGVFAEARSGVMNPPPLRSITHLVDGTTSTILLAESAWRASTTHESSLTGSAGRKRWYACMDSRFVHGGESSRLLSSGRWRMNPSDEDGVTARRSAASSEHSGGAMFAFADGSVKLLSDDIEHSGRSWNANDPYDAANGGRGFGLYQRLWCINDGLIANLNP